MEKLKVNLSVYFIAWMFWCILLWITIAFINGAGAAAWGLGLRWLYVAGCFFGLLVALAMTAIVNDYLYPPPPATKSHCDGNDDS